MWKQQLDEQKKLMQMEKSVCSIVQLYLIYSESIQGSAIVFSEEEKDKALSSKH